MEALTLIIIVLPHFYAAINEYVSSLLLTGSDACLCCNDKDLQLSVSLVLNCI